MKQMFESERIRYVELAEELIPDYLVMINDNERVNRFLSRVREPITYEREIAWVRGMLAEGAVAFSMLEKGSGAFIGNVELMDVTDTEGELGIALTGDMQDRGYGTEAVVAVVQYGRERLGLKRIRLRADPANARAIHVYEKCGFREYDRSDEDVYMEIK